MKKLLNFSFVSLLALALFFSINVKKEDTSNLVKTNISLLTAEAQGEIGGTASNTGPRSEVECGHLGITHKMVCKSENSVGCTDSDCF